MFGAERGTQDGRREMRGETLTLACKYECDVCATAASSTIVALLLLLVLLLLYIATATVVLL